MKTANEYGTVEISKSAFDDIANIAASGIKGIYPGKKNGSICDCVIKDDEMTINISIRVKSGIDIVRTSSRLQSKVHEIIEEMTGIDCKKINVSIIGFEK